MPVLPFGGFVANEWYNRFESGSSIPLGFNHAAQSVNGLSGDLDYVRVVRYLFDRAINEDCFYSMVGESFTRVTVCRWVWQAASFCIQLHSQLTWPVSSSRLIV